jgi:hypothetical protein
MLSTVPPLATLFSRSWSIKEYTRLVLFISWWPGALLPGTNSSVALMYFISGLYIMMSHMARQRRKVLNKRKTQ